MLQWLTHSSLLPCHTYKIQNYRFPQICCKRLMYHICKYHLCMCLKFHYKRQPLLNIYICYW